MQNALDNADTTVRININALLDAAQNHFDAGHFDEAESALKAVVEHHPDHGEALEGLAYIAANQQNHSLASGYFDRALGHLPPLATRVHDAALSHQAAGNHARAVQLLEEALALSPRHIESMHAAALSLTVLDENERALGLFKRAASLNPTSWQIQYNMGRPRGLLERFD